MAELVACSLSDPKMHSSNRSAVLLNELKAKKILSECHIICIHTWWQLNNKQFGAGTN
jgi:hypothetical protein